MKTMNPYLNFNGNAEEAFNFYRSVFGGEFVSLQRFKDTPDALNIPASDKEKIMHISLSIGNGNILMASDTSTNLGRNLIKGNNVYISISAESKEEADKLFNGLSKDGNVEMPLQQTFWGAFFGMFADKFGIQWMISFETAQNM